MAELGFLDHNENRAYPFDVSVRGHEVRQVLVDIAVRLGEDYPLNLVDETAHVCLERVEDNAGPFTWSFFFSRSVGGASLGDGLEVVVPKNAPRFSTYYGRGTAGTYISLTVGQIEKLTAPTALAVNLPLELRTVVVTNAGTPVDVCVFNAVRRQPYQQYFTPNPNNSPAQDYANAKAAAGVWEPNIVSDPGECLTPGGDNELTLVGGYNTEITPDTGIRQLNITYVLGGGAGRNCEPVPGDQLIFTKQGTLRSFNGRRPDADGNLVLTAGNGTRLIMEPDLFRLRLVIDPVRPSDQCPVSPQERDEPTPVPIPPSKCEG